MKTKITQRQKENWIKDLLSQKYDKCKGSFYKGENQCCVLGVFGLRNNKKLFTTENDDRNYIYLSKLLGRDLVNKLWRYNDSNNRSFKWFAAYIKRYVQPKD